jgi:hypothetical protein
MTALDLLQQLHTLAVVVTPTPEGDLSVKPPKSVLTDALRLAIREHKAALLALLQAPPDSVPSSACSRIGPHNYMKQRNPLAREEVQWRCSVCNALQEVSPWT